MTCSTCRPSTTPAASSTRWSCPSEHGTGADRTVGSVSLDDRRLVKISKYLARHLRHDPARRGLTLAPGGWVAVTDLLDTCAAHNFRITREELDEVVARNDKRRFGFDETGERLRANQGHSVPIDLGLVPATPPDVLFHGTNVAVLKRILDEGLRPMNRHHVHLSTAAESARRVGARRGRPVVLAVDSQLMAVEGITFYVTENAVWLTSAVAPRFLRLL